MSITAIPPAGETRSDETPQIPDERQRYVALFADIARIMGEHPEIPRPYFYGANVDFNVFGDGAPAIIAVIRRAIGGKWDKESRETSTGAYLDYVSTWHGFPVTITTSRDEVCRRVVKGTREVTKKVKDPEALAAVPEIEVTETVEDFEWVCEPLLPAALADGDSGVAA
jgi:hypothetical protein